MKHFCTYHNCKASFPRPSKLELHIRKIHLQETLFKCPYLDCGKDYTQAAHLKRHVEICHQGKTPVNSDLTPFIFQCGIVDCDKKFATQLGLERHHKIHLQEREFKCSHCSATFRLKRVLEKHIFTHTGIARYKCEKCSLNFNDYNKFVKHKKHAHLVHFCKRPGCNNLQFDDFNMLRKHENSVHPLKFSCAECSKQFLRRLHLIEHISSEHECLTFQCHYKNCDRAFSYKRNLDSHVRMHHKNIRFLCTECGRELCTKQKLKEHIVKIHQTARRPKKQSDKWTKSRAAQVLGLSHKEDKLLEKEAEKLEQTIFTSLPTKVENLPSNLPQKQSSPLVE